MKEAQQNPKTPVEFLLGSSMRSRDNSDNWRCFPPPMTIVVVHQTSSYDFLSTTGVTSIDECGSIDLSSSDGCCCFGESTDDMSLSTISSRASADLETSCLGAGAAITAIGVQGAISSAQLPGQRTKESNFFRPHTPQDTLPRIPRRSTAPEEERLRAPSTAPPRLPRRSLSPALLMPSDNGKEDKEQTSQRTRKRSQSLSIAEARRPRTSDKIPMAPVTDSLFVAQYHDNSRFPPTIKEKGPSCSLPPRIKPIPAIVLESLLMSSNRCKRPLPVETTGLKDRSSQSLPPSVILSSRGLLGRSSSGTIGSCIGKLFMGTDRVSFSPPKRSRTMEAVSIPSML